MNKELIIKRFKRSLSTYDANAQIQWLMADTLVSKLSQECYKSVLEIGCGTGILTRKCVENIQFDNYVANDIVDDCKVYIAQINPKIEFLCGDITEIDLKGCYDLIISNAVFQWFSEPDVIIKKLKLNLTRNGNLLFSSFGQKNFYELREILGLGLAYPVFSNVFKSDYYELVFPSVVEMFKHIKNTGVNAITEYKFTRKDLDIVNDKFIARYGKVKLTYNPIFSCV